MLSWPEQGTGGENASAAITIRNGGVTRMNMAIAGPRTATSLRMPVFPAGYTDFNPQAGDTTFSVTGFVARSTGGWDRARPYVFRYDFRVSLDWLGQGDMVSCP